MANITLSELHVAGSEFFQDSESFLNDMSDADNVVGGSYLGFSDMSLFSKLTESFVITYGIGHIGYLAKSFSASAAGVYY
ncbi:hypothetical protein VB711_13385 [Cronbergia sp. UHCC 0137]|uniref:hypothetical protein n=1 Tax=Cronbergia sp. UHCC 0137 TaxID=3110239 RepID=UPI002B2141D2|nr:hypothetical protein [Cronbergia sp. UHCC 0137]MEA5618824.1 hypothetical protein [Cronbergia sp. UHCC 0137]